MFVVVFLGIVVCGSAVAVRTIGLQYKQWTVVGVDGTVARTYLYGLFCVVVCVVLLCDLIQLIV